jgi:hypothetical protein
MSAPIIIISISLLIFPLYGFPQNDKKISSEKIPFAISSYIKGEYPQFKKVKYYKETINDTIMYEVELRKKEEKFSLLFYENGQLYEVEKEVKYKELQAEIRKNVEAELASRFLKYKINKVQFVNPHLVNKYEMNVKGKTDKGISYFEIYFNKDGKFIELEEIKLKAIPSAF